VDLLVLTRLTAWRIVLGKWVSLVAQSALLTAAMLPYGVVRYYLGPVDLANDLLAVVAMLLGSALLTAVALWASGWPKGVRALAGIALVVGFMPVMAMLSDMLRYYGRGYGGPGPFALFSVSSWTWRQVLTLGVLLYDAGLVGLFSLVQAARKLAPAAENHALTTRALALLALLPPPVIAAGAGRAWGGEESALGHLALSGAALLIVCGMEVSAVAQPLRVHSRPWWRRGSWHTLVGRFALPGWPSAALFCVVALVCVFAAAVVCDNLVDLPFDLRFGAWWLALGWAALVFPALVLSLWRNATNSRLVTPGYWIIQGLLGIVSVVSLANSAGGGWGPRTKGYIIALDAASQVVPVSSFWLTTRLLPAHRNLTAYGFSPGIMLGQALMLVGTVWLYRRRSRDHWAGVWAQQVRRPGDEDEVPVPAVPPAEPDRAAP